METLYSDVTISMSEFKKNPAAVLRDAKRKPVAVLNHNKAAFYMIEPALFEASVCLRSLPIDQNPVVYVDSGSSDDSVQRARDLGADVEVLDMTVPFSAARARNEG